MSLSRTSIVSLLAVTLAAQACGGDDDNGSGSGGPSTTASGGSATTGAGGNTNPTTSNGSGGTSSGGTSAGGSSAGGSAAGGTSAGSGGTTTDAGGTGGTGTGGTDTGTGGTGTGGTGTGGSAGDSTTGEGGAPPVECNLPYDEETVGAAGAAAFDPRVIATFDEPGSAVGWQVYVDGNSQGSVGDAHGYRSLDDGLSCAGSIAVEIPYDHYADSLRVSLERGFGNNPGQDWSGATRAHLAIRIEEPASGNLAHLSWGNFFIQSGDWGIWSQANLNYTQLGDFEWHDIVIDLTTVSPAPDLSNINQMGIQIAPHSAAPAGAPAVPPHTIVYVDDIWLE